MTREELMMTPQGAVLTVPRKDGSKLFLLLEYCEEILGSVFVHAKRVYSVSPEGEYLGADHFEDPYEFTEERLKDIQCADEKTQQFLSLEFGKAGRVVHNYPSSC